MKKVNKKNFWIKNFFKISLFLFLFGLLLGIIVVVSLEFLRSNFLSYIFIPFGLGIILFSFFATFYLIFGKK